MRNLEFSSGDPIKAFDAVRRGYPQFDYIGNPTLRPSLEQLSPVAADYLFCGLQFFIWRSANPRLAEAANITDSAIQRGIVPVIVTPDHRDFAYEMGITLIEDRKDGANVGFPMDIRDGTKAYVLLPGDFVYSAQTAPIRALSDILLVSSVIRDFINQRRYKDPHQVLPRAHAYMAEFLPDSGCMDDLRGLPMRMLEIWRQNPHGINGLPQEAIYESEFWKPLI